MSCPSTPSPGESQSGPAVGSAPDETHGGDLPAHNWRHTVSYGLVFWAAVAAAWLLVPAGHPLQLGVVLSGLFAAPLLPVALCCDYRQARRIGACEPDVRAYLSNLGRDIATAIAGRRALGEERREFLQC